MGDVDLDALASDLGFVLKSEQKEAVESLLKGRDVFGVLPKAFGKSLIFQLLVLAKKQSFQFAKCFQSNAPQLSLFVRSKALWKSRYHRMSFSMK